MHLIVIHAFGNYQRGDRIDDAAAIAAAREHNAHNVVPVDADKTAHQFEPVAPKVPGAA